MLEPYRIDNSTFTAPIFLICSDGGSNSADDEGLIIGQGVEALEDVGWIRDMGNLISFHDLFEVITSVVKSDSF